MLLILSCPASCPVAHIYVLLHIKSDLICFASSMDRVEVIVEAGVGVAVEGVVVGVAVEIDGGDAEAGVEAEARAGARTVVAVVLRRLPPRIWVAMTAKKSGSMSSGSVQLYACFMSSYDATFLPHPHQTN